jgi:hypothetical protein
MRFNTARVFTWMMIYRFDVEIRTECRRRNPLGVRYKLVAVLPAPVRNHLVVQLVVAHNLG